MMIVLWVLLSILIVAEKVVDGITVKNEVFTAYMDVRFRTTKVILFRMSSDLTEILVDNQILMEDIGKTVTDPYMAFVNLLPLDDCRYAVYLVNYEINYSKEESLVFILWCPASASLRNKMTYASYKDYFRALLIGINKEFIVDSIDTFEDRTTFAEKIGGPLVNSLEGVPLK